VALPASGPISFADINAEIRRSGSATTSLGESAVRTAGNRRISNQSISFSDLYGKTYGASTVFLAAISSPRAHAYRWSQGFGTKYSDPASPPNATTYHVAANVKKTAVGFNQNTSTNRYLSFYPWSDASGFGTRYAATATYPTAAALSTNGGATFNFSPDGNAVVVGSIAGTPTTVAWAWTDANGFGTKFSDPATSPPDCYFMHFFGGPLGAGNAPSEVIIFGSASTDADRLSAWNFNSSSGWGAKMSNPSTMPLSGVFTCTSDVFTVITGTQSASTTERRSAAYDFGFTTGFGTKYSAMAATDILGNPSGTQMSWVATGSVSPVVSYVWGRTSGGLAGTGIATFPWYSNGWGSKYSDPAVPIPSADGSGEEVSFNLNLDLGVAHEGSPYVTVYPWNNGYGTKYANPSTSPGSNCSSIQMATSF
jgi:hypothetical protein